MYTNRAPAVLRSSTVSVKQQWGCLQSLLPGNRRQTTTPAAPSPPPPASVVEPVQPTTVVLQAAAEPDIVPLPPPPAPRLPPPTRSFFDVMKFNGPAPELINGRLAMIGILAAANNEIQTGQTVLQQALTASPWVYVMLLVWIYASLVPITKGARHEPFGIFTPRAEITNGRAAMLGFAILVALEYKAQVPFF